MPSEEKDTPLFSAMKGTVHILGDLIAPIGEGWVPNKYPIFPF